MDIKIKNTTNKAQSVLNEMISEEGLDISVSMKLKLD
jgi:hypothetical protein